MKTILHEISKPVFREKYFTMLFAENFTHSAKHQALYYAIVGVNMLFLNKNLWYSLELSE